MGVFFPIGGKGRGFSAPPGHGHAGPLVGHVVAFPAFEADAVARMRHVDPVIDPDGQLASQQAAALHSRVGTGELAGGRPPGRTR
jgi:hypothetical protein